MAAGSAAKLNTDGLKAALAERLTISQVAEGLGAELQASGEQWRCLCLLHDEHTPSMYINDAKGVYHCFGCEVGGDAIDLVERAKHLTFMEALYYLAAEAELDANAYARPLTEEEREREEFLRWCQDWLTVPSDYEPPARVDPYTGSLFGVVERRPTGTWGSTPTYFQQKAYLLDGVILPWRLPSGRLVGWRVREHAGHGKSVVGTPNDFPLGRITERTLFGIQLAREHLEDGRLVVVEGEYDTLALHSHGVRHVVGMGGKTLSGGQMELVEQLRVRELVLVLDGDDAGRLAAKGLAERYWSHNVLVRITVCPHGYDPETLVAKQGDWAFLSLAESAPSALEYLLRLEWEARDRGTLTSKLDFVRWIREAYGGRLRASEESLVLAEVSRWLGIPELEVRDFVRAGDGNLSAADSERVLLGKACRDQGFCLYLRQHLVKEDFFVLKHQRLWEILAQALIDGHEPDPVMLESQATRHGLPSGYVTGLLELPETNLDYHMEQVADLSLRRSARDDALAFKDRITDRQRPAEQLVGDLTHRITSKALRKTGAAQRQMADQVDTAMETLHERMRNPDEIHGFGLGSQYPRLSRTLQGLQPKRLVLVAAISGVGKSTMLCTWAAVLAVHQSLSIDLVSLEMDETELLYKIASHLTGIDSLKISGGALRGPEVQAVEHAMVRIRNSPLHIWTPDGLTGTEFLLYARESVMQRRTRAFFLDYVQLIDPEPGQERDNGYKIYGDFGRLVKMKVARAMDVPVVCAAQLNRAASAKERPTKEDMGDSYALVRHSDVIVILQGQEDSSTVELHVDKNRQGAGGGGVTIPIVYDKPTQTFHEAGIGDKRPEYAVHV